MPDEKHNHKLNGVHKGFILRCLASGFYPNDIVDFVQDEFGIKITPPNVCYYSNTYPVEIERLRNELAGDLEQIPFAKKLTRVAYLDRVAKKQYRKRQFKDFAQTLKQIAEETGGLVQKHEHSGPNGGPIKTQDVTAEMDPEERRRLLEEYANR